MVATRETSAPEEESEANMEEHQEAATTSIIVDSTQGRLATRCALFLRIDSLLMAPMEKKRGEGGMVTCKCVRMRVITEGKISLSRVVVSQ